MVGLLLCSLVGLSSCRYSDTLLDIIIDPDQGVEEAHADPVFKEVEGAPVNPDLASVHLDENENFAHQADFLPVYKEDAGINGQAVKRKHSNETPDSTNAVEGDEQDDTDEANTSTSEETEEVETDASGEGETTEQQQTSPDGGDEQADRTSGRGGTGKVYGDGNYEELPDARCVAAKGQYALIAQMLGGKGAVAAADAPWLARMQEAGAFPGEGLESVAAAWDSEGALDMDALIASPADAILVDGVDVALTEDQSARLTQEGFNIVYVPHLGETYTADKDILTGVKVVGQILSGLNSQSNLSTADMTEKYLQLHDSAINGCLNANGGYSYKMVGGTAYQGIYQGTATSGEQTDKLSANRITTACIDSWASPAAASITAQREFGFHELYLNGQTISLSGGVGLSACTVGGNFILIDYYLQTAGVVNNAYDGPKPVVASSQNTIPYAVVPGDPNGMTAQQTAPRVYPSALWYSQTGVFIDDTWIAAGDEGFPGVITRDAEMAGKVAQSAARGNGLYNTGSPYQVFQIPSGVAGNWFDGNVESFMSSVWAYSVFQGADLNDAREWIESFYKLFYRIDTDALSRVDGFGTTLAASCPKGQ